MSDNIKLGARYRDPVTGVEGILVSRTRFLHGCDRCAIQPPKDKDGKVPEAIHTDVLALEYVDEGILKDGKVPGAPAPQPKTQLRPEHVAHPAG